MMLAILHELHCATLPFYMNDKTPRFEAKFSIFDGSSTALLLPENESKQHAYLNPTNLWVILKLVTKILMRK